MPVNRQTRQADSRALFPWLTVELALWGALLLISLAFRVLRLDAAPLNSHEAHDALAAWRFSGGQGTSGASVYSPALFSAQSILFAVFGASDMSARILPAVAGAAFAVAPALLRNQLGRIGALAAAALLAFSPTSISLSRTASGDVLVALSAMLCASGLGRLFSDTEPGSGAGDSITSHSGDVLETNTEGAQAAVRLPRAVYMMAAGIALILVSGPLAFSALLSLGAALVVAVFVDTDSRHSLHRDWMRLRAAPRLVQQGLVIVLSGTFLLSTAFAWNFAGLGAAAALLPEWLGGFIRWPESLSFGYPGLILVFYEPLTLLLGALGVVLVTFRMSSFSLVLALWSISALLVALIRPGHSPGDVLLVLAPLACLGGQAFAALVDGLRRRGSWLNEGLYLAVTLPLWAYLVLNMATYSGQPAQYTHLDFLFIDVSLPTFLSLVVITAVLLLILAAAIGFVQGPEPAVRGLVLSTSVALLFYTTAAASGVSQNRATDPRELLVIEPTASEVRLLQDSLSRLSHERGGDAHAIDVTVLTDDSALAWVLRDFTNARWDDQTESLPASSAIVAPFSPGSRPLGDAYIGQRFPLRRDWSMDNLSCQWIPAQIGHKVVRQLDCSALVDWLVYRQAQNPPVAEQVVLWLRQDAASP